MLVSHNPWRTALLCLCLLGLAPISEARQEQDQERFQKHEDKASKQRDDNDDELREKDQKGEPRERRERTIRPEPHKQPRKNRKEVQRPEKKQPERRERMIRPEPHKQPPKIRKEVQRPVLKQPERRERTIWRDPGKIKKPARRDPGVTRWTPRTSHDRYYDRYSRKKDRAHTYHRYETYHYHTRYLAPIRHHYYRPGFRTRILPRGYVRIVIGNFPYFYFGGIFYRHHVDGYIVVGAPIGAIVHDLPLGFIAFNVTNFTYYYVNDTYYLWDDFREAYVVVAKPPGADDAIATATTGRLFVYPNHGQSEEQQARDRYECHRWAVHQTGVDPSLWDEMDLSIAEQLDYKRAISACLQGRGYTVK